jgi:hypothetical protein
MDFLCCLELLLRTPTAWRQQDPEDAGLGLIQASLLAVNFADNELNPVELGGLERAIAQVSTVAP